MTGRQDDRQRIIDEYMTDKYDNKRAVLHFRGFFYKIGIYEGFPLHNINFAERNSEAAMGKVGSGGHYIFEGAA